MAHLNDYEIDRIQKQWTENDISTAGAAVTITHAAVAGVSHAIMKVDASYSDPTTSGLLTIKFGSVTKGRKYIHGAGALDFSEAGYENPTANEEVSAVLAAGGGVVVACLTMTGFSTTARA